jgi:L-malate glycosyltransferase
MHICMICDKFPPRAAGGGFYAYGLSRKLIERKHQVTVITRGSWEKPYYQEEVNGINVYRVRFIPIFPFHLQPHGFFISRFLQSIESDFDVIHLHNSNIPVVGTKVPKVVTVHGTMQGHVVHLKGFDLYSSVVRTFSPMYTAIDKEVINSADKVIAISNSCAEELRLFYEIKNPEIIRNAVDSTFFIPLNHKDINNPYVLYTGRLSSEKGLIDLIKAAKSVSEKYPKIKFVITGKGPLERHLKRMVAKLNLERNFCFVGYVSRNTLLQYYQNATLYVLPSYWEGLPTTLLEAMSCELPVVATSVAGTSEVLVHRQNGLLVPPNNPEKLAISILELIGNGALRQDLGRNARMHVKEFYDWNTIVDKIERVYQDAYSRRS